MKRIASVHRLAAGLVLLATGSLIGVLDTPRRLEAIPQCACYILANNLPNVQTCIGTLQAGTATTCSRGAINQPCNISGGFAWTPGACARSTPQSQVQPTNAATGTSVGFNATQTYTNQPWGPFTFTCWAIPGQVGGWEAAVYYWYWTGNCQCYDSGSQISVFAAEIWRCEI